MFQRCGGESGKRNRRCDFFHVRLTGDEFGGGPRHHPRRVRHHAHHIFNRPDASDGLFRKRKTQRHGAHQFAVDVYR